MQDGSHILSFGTVCIYQEDHVINSLQLNKETSIVTDKLF